MGAFADLQRRTGVGVGGVFLYVGLLAGIVAGVELAGDLPTHAGSVRLVAFLPGLVVAVGLLGVVSALSNLPRAVSLAAARRGTGAHTGTAEPLDRTLESPVEGVDALCYSSRILENDVDAEPDPDDEANWSLAAMGTSGVPFGVRANGRRLRVDPDGADVYLPDRTGSFLAADEEEPDALAALRREAGVERDPGTAYRFQESVLAPGDGAFVRWEGSPEDGAAVVADAGYPERVRGRVVSGLLLGVPTTALGALGLLFAAGAL